MSTQAQRLEAGQYRTQIACVSAWLLQGPKTTVRFGFSV